MRNFILKLFKDFELVLAGTFLCVTVLVVIINVALRYLFHDGLYWAEEVATTSFIWSVFIGAAAAYRYKMHIGIELINRFGPETFRKLVGLIIHLMMLVINGYIVYLSVLFIQANKLKRTSVLDIPAFYVNLALTIGFSLITIHALRFFWRDLRQFTHQSEKDLVQ